MRVGAYNRIASQHQLSSTTEGSVSLSQKVHMKSFAVRLSLLPAVLFFIALVAPPIVHAQEERTRPIPENPPSESPKPEPPPSPPAEAPRSEPPPSPPAEAPRSEPPPSPPAETPRSEPPSSAPNNGGSRNNDGGSSRGNNDNRRNDNDRRTDEGGGRGRGTMSGDGSGNRRDRVIQTDSGEVIVPGRTGGGNPTAGNPGADIAKAIKIGRNILSEEDSGGN
jgi:outer membrane biosynthesis protein TonB